MSDAGVMEICGENGIRRTVAAFYRQVRTDELIGPMYPAADWEGWEERLADFHFIRTIRSGKNLEFFHWRVCTGRRRV